MVAVILTLALFTFALKAEAQCEHIEIALGYVYDGTWVEDTLILAEVSNRKRALPTYIMQDGHWQKGGLLQTPDGVNYLAVDTFNENLVLYEESPVISAVVVERDNNTIQPTKRYEFPTLNEAFAETFTYERVLVGSKSSPDLVFVGQVKKKDEDWDVGVFQVQSSELVKWLDIDFVEPLHVAVRLPGSILATLQGKVYLLLIQEKPRIVRVDSSLVPVALDFEPKPMQEPSRIPPRVRAREYAKFMATMEESTLPVSLVGRGDYLYILMREHGEERTRWSLARVNPDTNPAGTQVLELPFQANHMLVFPGNGWWAFLEQGPFRAIWDQDTTGIWFVPDAEVKRAFDNNGTICGK